MFSTDDTIVAIATPAGRGGIGVLRVSGSQAREIAESILVRTSPLAPRHATFTRVRSAQGGVVDDVIATWFPAPRSYTGEDVVEVSAHGSPAVLAAILEALIGRGGRLARPGEFTLRAYLNGRLDLVQAEAVADLIDAATPMQARVAFDQLEGSLSGRIRTIDDELLDLVASLEASLDFPDEGFHFITPNHLVPRIDAVIANLDAVLAQAARGRLIREGATVVIVGRPNVGKSSLFNALVGQERAIVTAWAGTTRDLVTERVELAGLEMTLVDTAGLRETLEGVEREGVARARQACTVADLVLAVLDGGAALTEEDQRLVDEVRSQRHVVAANKSDVGPVWNLPGAVRVSALTREGLEDLRRAIVEALTGTEPLQDTAAVTNIRHVTLLAEARVALQQGRDAAALHAAPEEFVLADLHAARGSLSEVVGVGTSEEILNRIFERFCVGK
jgi:tRNA modification GTPase